MKWLFKWVVRLVVAVVAIAVLLLVFRDTILRGVVERELQSQTGMEVKLGKISSGFFSPVVTLENLKLYNTAEFGGGLFLDVPELHLEFDSAALARQKLRVTLMRCSIAEVAVVRNEAGQTNVLNLLAKASGGVSKSGAVRFSGKQFQFERIDALNLSLARARFVDLKNPRNNHESRVNMQRLFRQVQGTNDLNGILTMIWLDSGGTFALKADPAGAAKK